VTAAEPVFRDRATYLPGPDTLVLTDLHVGLDATSNVEFPMGERANLTDRLGALLDRFDPETVVLGGDLLHAFEYVPDGVPETVAALCGVVARANTDLVVVRGNHDTMLDALGADFDAVSEYRLDDDTVVCHGDVEPDTDADRYVVGHDHPAIEIEGRRRPCYLLGDGVYHRADVLVLPAFNRLAAGTVVNGADGRDLLSPLVLDLDPFRPVVRDEDADETLRFPPLGRFRRLL
jgi:putative SbcD/Mre11-related phosphoesterase